MEINSVRAANILAKEERKKDEEEALAKIDKEKYLTPEMRLRLENLRK